MITEKWAKFYMHLVFYSHSAAAQRHSFFLKEGFFKSSMMMRESLIFFLSLNGRCLFFSQLYTMTQHAIYFSCNFSVKMHQQHVGTVAASFKSGQLILSAVCLLLSAVCFDMAEVVSVAKNQEDTCKQLKFSGLPYWRSCSCRNEGLRISQQYFKQTPLVGAYYCVYSDLSFSVTVRHGRHADRPRPARFHCRHLPSPPRPVRF